MKKDFALDLKLSRERAGLSNRDVAHLLGCSKERISKLENGKARITPDELISLTIVYGQDFESPFVTVTKRMVELLKERLADFPAEPANWERKHQARQDTFNGLAYRLANLIPWEDEC